MKSAALAQLWKLELSLYSEKNQAGSTSEQPFREMFVRVVVQSRLSLAEWMRPERVWKRFPSKTYSC